MNQKGPGSNVSRQPLTLQPPSERFWNVCIGVRLETDIDLVREATNENWVLGNEHFKRQVEELAGRRASLHDADRKPAISSAHRA